ncbi:uncharacterized protein LOC111864259 isoform X2 [Cryptotermes secundus]|uniref:uncharacterized protein LOC111864259 isoform X2 n=1 Tax=Cryptotermes secundus TaxID=105785 RepID=UPI000CD7C444|nr:uncharacterized protein LOC111864259 isoform X2 [Cryptotermes secundus]
MKGLLIQDDDEQLFNVCLHPVLYRYYKENLKEIRRMVKQQGAGFWIQFVTSFRSFISNFDPGITNGCESHEEEFIDMLKMLTTENSFTAFISVIESLHRLLVLVASQRGYFMMAAQIMRAHAISGFHKPLDTVPLYIRFVGSVVVLYQRWKHAPQIRSRTPPAKWSPPAHWSQQNGHGPSLYECYLHDRWGDKLYRMICMDKDLMKFFKSHEGDSTSASSKNQNKMDSTYTTRPRRNRKRGHRKRKGGAKRPSGIQNETVVDNDREETDSPGAKDRFNVEHSARDGSNAQTQNKSSSIRQEQEPGPSAATSNKTEQTDTFKYGRLFNFGRRKTHEESDGSNVKQNAQERDASFCEAERSGTVNVTQKDSTFRYDKLFNFNKKRHVDGKETDSPCAKDSRSNVEHIAKDKGNVKTQNKSGSISQKQEQKKEPGPSVATSNKNEQTDTFRYDRLFKFGKRKTYDESDGSNVKQKAQERVASFCEAEQSGTVNMTQKDPTFRYDKLFSFDKKREADGNSGGESAAKNKQKEKEHISAQKGLPIDIDVTGKTAKSCFFRYDRLFTFSNKERTDQPDSKVDANAAGEHIEIKTHQKKGNVPSTTDKEPASYHSDTADSFRSSTDDPYGCDSKTESEDPKEDYIGSDRFYRGPSYHAHYKNRVPQPVWKFLMQKCRNCNILEKYPGMYQACMRCISEEVQEPNIYCGEHCGRTHWWKQHHTDHK